MTPRARAIALLVLGMAIHLATLVLAQEPKTGAFAKVVLIGPSQHPLVTRMRDELGVLGMEVEIIAQPSARADLATIARSHNAAAIARVEVSPPEIILWVDPTLHGADEPNIEIHVSESAEGPTPQGILALRAVELLRGKLVPAGPAASKGASPPTLPMVATPDDAGAKPAPSSSASSSPSATLPGVATNGSVGAKPLTGPRPAGVFVGAAVLLSPGGVPAAPQARIGATYHPIARIGLEALAYLPTTASTVSSTEGAVHVRVLHLGLDFRGLLTDPGANLELCASLGLGAMALFFQGEAQAPYLAQSGSRWLPAPYTALTASYRLYPRLSLRSDILAALARPEPIVRIVDRDAASFGQPAIFLSLGVEVRP